MSLAYCFGAIFGDGSTYIEHNPGKTYVLWFSSSTRTFAEKLVSLFQTLGYNPYFYPRFSKHQFRWIVKVKNKSLYEKYQCFKESLNLQELLVHDALQFLKGFFDAEGCLTENCAVFSNTNADILIQIKKFLAENNINSGQIRVNCAKGTPININGVHGFHHKDVLTLSIYKDRKKFAKLLCMEA